MMQVDNNILFFAFRYALGRRSTAVSSVSEAMIRNWDKLSDNEKEIIKKEIREAILTDRIGDKCDKDNWEVFLNLK